MRKETVQKLRSLIREEIQNVKLTEATDIEVDNIKYKIYFKRTSKTSHDVIIKQGSQIAFEIEDGVVWTEGYQQYQNAGMNYYPNFLGMGTGQGDYYKTVPGSGPFMDTRKKQYAIECIAAMKKHNLQYINAGELRDLRFKD